jgi:hypothetical protein
MVGFREMFEKCTDQSRQDYPITCCEPEMSSRSKIPVETILMIHVISNVVSTDQKTYLILLVYDKIYHQFEMHLIFILRIFSLSIF